MKKCPYCGEEIKDEAIKCRYCGEMIEIGKLTEDIKRGRNSKKNKFIKIIISGLINFFGFFTILGLALGASETPDTISLIFLFIFLFMLAFLFPFTSIRKNFKNFILNFKDFKKLKFRYISFIILSIILLGTWIGKVNYENNKPIVNIQEKIKLNKIVDNYDYIITGTNIKKVIANGKEYKVNNNKVIIPVDLKEFPEQQIKLEIVGNNGDKIEKNILITRPRYDYEKILPEVKILSPIKLNKIILTGYLLKLQFKNTTKFTLDDNTYQIPTTGEYIWSGNLILSQPKINVKILAYNKYNKIKKEFIITRPLTKEEKEIERLKKIKPEIKVLTETKLDYPQTKRKLRLNFKNTDYFTINGEKYDKNSTGVIILNNKSFDFIKSPIKLTGRNTSFKVIAYNKYNNTEKNIIIKNPITKEEAEEKIKTQFSSWDGSHRNLVRILKENYLKDPDSFKHIETKYSLLWDKQNKNWYLFVVMKYRAKNSFGGYVINGVKSYFDLDGNPIMLDKWENFIY